MSEKLKATFITAAAVTTILCTLFICITYADVETARAKGCKCGDPK